VAIDENAEITSRGPIAEIWCELKHLLHAEGHAEEMMANAARDGNDSEVLRISRDLDAIRNIRQRTVQAVMDAERRAAGLAGPPRSAVGGCERCSADLIPAPSGLGMLGVCPACLMAFMV